jgi:diguanylate cyclase
MPADVERSHLADRLQLSAEDLGQAPAEAGHVAKLSHGAIGLTTGAVGIFVAYLLWQVTRLGGASHSAIIGDTFFIPADVLAICATVGASWKCRSDRRRRLSWMLVAVAMAGYLVGDLLQLFREGIHHIPDSPDWSDAAFYLFFFVGLVGFTSSHRNAVRRWLFTLDLMTIALSGGALLWYFVAGPLATTRGHSVHTVVYAVLYPLGDLILLLTAIRTLQRGVPPSSQRSVRTIAVGIFVYVIADAMTSYMRLHAGYRGGDLVDVMAVAAATLFTVAGALQPVVKAQEHWRPQSGRSGSTGISYAAAAAVFVLVFVIQRHDKFFPDLSILGIAILIAILVAISQVLIRRAFVGEQVKNEGLVGELRHQAFHDGLTGVANRALFSERLEHALDRRRSSSVNHAVLMIDLDGFKTINDSFGHDAGDEVLRIVSARLQGAVRRGDTVARLGGDEFAVLFEDVKGDTAVTELVIHLLGTVRAPMTIAERQIVQEASIGVVLTDEEPHTAEELLHYADVAMYQAKGRSHGQYCVFETSMQVALSERVELEADLRGAVRRGELRVFYQPILDLSSQDTIGFEALARWMHPSRGLLLPAAFIPLAEQGGLIHEIDTWVLHQACAEASWWQHESPQFAQIGVHVNLSPLQLREPDLVDTVISALSTAGLDPKFLTLELLESSVVNDLELAQSRLTDLKAIGLRIAVDDFGTGYSSLSHLRTLPIDELKIDRSFIAAMRTSVQASTLVRSLIQLGAALGINTVAEGIEEPEQVMHLRDEDCVHGQGFLFARPLDREDLRSYLSERGGELAGQHDETSLRDKNVGSAARDPVIAIHNPVASNIA